MSESQLTIIEVNGVKLEVDLRTAKRIDELKIGSRVKCLVKTYDSFITCPGVIVGFEPFNTLPTIIVAYIEQSYNSAGLKFKSFNSHTKDFEIVADLDHNALEVDRESILNMFARDIEKKESELRELIDKRTYFTDHFDVYFKDKFSKTTIS